MTPFPYVGKVWCIRVGSGAFVARRNGKVFVTGNSGFPKGKGCLKPAWEPIILARKPGKGVLPLGVDECRVPAPEGLTQGGCKWKSTGGVYAQDAYTKDNPALLEPAEEHPSGRWPANVVHDGSAEVLEAFAAFGRKSSGKEPTHGLRRQADKFRGVYSAFGGQSVEKGVLYGDTGTAARFFYCAKASRAERGAGNTHPTLKPLALMEWLVKLVCPPDRLCLDPFMGSGTTGKACQQTGRRFIGIELDPTYFRIAEERLARAAAEVPA